jgi:hypothetical protein
MDVIAHLLWSYLLFHNSEHVWLAVIFGGIADVIFLVPMLTALIMKGFVKLERPPLEIIPDFIMTIYNSMHSLVTFFLAFFAVYFITGSFHWYMLAWLIHIIVDIPMHSKNYFPTTFLYPISKFTINGYPWEKPWLVGLNYALLAIGYIMMTLGVI